VALAVPNSISYWWPYGMADRVVAACKSLPRTWKVPLVDRSSSDTSILFFCETARKEISLYSGSEDEVCLDIVKVLRCPSDSAYIHPVEEHQPENQESA
jgi:hypothetical protein